MSHTTSVDHGIAGEPLDALCARLDQLHPLQVVQWAADVFGSGLAMTSSFGADSMCTIHLATRVVPNIPIIFVNTGYLFPETLAFMEAMRTAYRLNVLEFHTRNDPIVWLTVHGEHDPRVRNNVDACCAANKDPVMDRAMRELAPRAYLRGIRADQTAQRGEMKIVQWMQRYQSYAISPLLHWRTREVYHYMKEHGLPHHPLVEQGYVSIGCNPVTCTRPISFGEDERAGRWSGSDKKECGINLDLGKDI